MAAAYQWEPGIIVATLTALVALVVAVVAVKQWHDYVARVLWWFVLAILVWVIAFAFELAATDRPTLWWWLRIEYLGIVGVGPLWLLVILRYLDLDRSLGRWLWPLLIVPPLLSYLALLTNDWHQLFYTTLEPGLYRRGRFFWLHTLIAYSYLVAALVVTITSAVRTSRPHQRRLLLLGTAAAIPFAGNAIFLGLGLPNRYDPTPALFAISGLLMAHGLTHGRLLQARPRTLRTALASLPDAVLIADTDGQIIEGNLAAHRLLGPAATGALADALAQLGVAPLDRAHLVRAVPQRRLIRSEERVLELSTTPVLEDHHITGLIVWVRDVTERERLIDELAAARTDLEARVAERTAELAAARQEADARASELTSALAAMPDGVIVTDAAGRPRLVNPAARALLGEPDPSLPLSQFLARLDLADLHGQPLTAAPLAAALTGEALATQELVLRSPAGEERHLAIGAAPVRSPRGARIGMVAIFHDITDLRQLERERREFVAMVVHELRTPVTGISMAAQMLQRRSARLPEAVRQQQEEPVHTLLRQTRRLTSLVNDLLEGARLEAGTLALQPIEFDLTALCRRLIDEAARLSPGHQFVAELAGPVQVHADPHRVEQIIINLLDNARKYSPAGQPITVTVTAAGEQALMSVRDKGYGIPASDLPHLFERFYRAARTAKAAGGLGLGLAVSHELAQRMGGALTVVSAEGRGSTFTLRLPIATKAGEQ